jgi:hypothetical protein
MARFGRLQVLGIDPPQHVEPACARCLLSLLRRAKLLHMQVADAAFVQCCGKLVLGKACPARRGDRPRVDQEADTGALDLGQHRRGLAFS